jgi:hypothetical protein
MLKIGALPVALLLLALSTTAAANQGDFAGGVAVGSSYAGVNIAPTNGLIVQGNVGIGNSSPGALLDLGLAGTTTGTLQLEGGSSGSVGIQPSGAAGSWIWTLPANAGTNGYVLTTNGLGVTSWQASGSVGPLPPMGRLTLASNTPVENADVTGATTVYYTDFNGDFVPVYNGSSWTENALSGQISLTLDSNSGHTGYQASGNNYDLFVGLNSGTLELCTGPAWSSSSSRGTGAGTTQLQMVNGIWTNENSMTCRYGNVSGNTLTCAANQCTFVGTMRATANGQTEHRCQSYSTAGGGPAVIGVSNAYNMVPVMCSEADTNSSWTYTGSSWRAADNSTSNSVSFISPLAQNPFDERYINNASNSTAGDQTYIGVSQIDSSTGVYRDALLGAPTNTVADNWQTLDAEFAGYCSLGYHTFYPVESCGGGTCSYSSSAQMLFTVGTTY